MVAVYAVAVVIGGLALVGWVIWQTWSEAPASERPGPEERFGPRGRGAVAGALGFGLGGMSAAYAGWNGLLTLVAAVAGAAALVVAGRLLSDEPA